MFFDIYRIIQKYQLSYTELAHNIIYPEQIYPKMITIYFTFFYKFFTILYSCL